MMIVGPDAAVCDQRYKYCKNIQIFLVCNTLGFNPPVYNPWPRKFRVQKEEVMIQKKGITRKQSRICFKQLLFFKLLIIKQMVARAVVSESQRSAVFFSSLILSLSQC